MHLVHVAAEGLVIPFEPLNKALWGNHARLLFGGLDLLVGEGEGRRPKGLPRGRDAPPAPYPAAAS
jgi:hypothetical protein